MALKTVEMVVDFRKNPATAAPINMCPSKGPSSHKTTGAEH